MIDKSYAFKIDMSIPIQAVGKARPRVCRNGHVYTPKKTSVAEEAIRAIGKVEMEGLPPYKKGLCASIDFIFEPPRSWSKKKREVAMMRGDFVLTKPDIDNALKTVLDALNGVVYEDDKQVADVQMQKHYGRENAIRISFWSEYDGD